VLSIESSPAPVAAACCSRSRFLLRRGGSLRPICSGVDPSGFSVNIHAHSLSRRARKAIAEFRLDGRSQVGERTRPDAGEGVPPRGTFPPFARKPRIAAMTARPKSFRETLKTSTRDECAPGGLRPPRSGFFQSSQPAGISPTEKEN